MINTNNYSHNRGSEVINQLTDYSNYDNIYSEILHYHVTEKYTTFPQKELVLLSLAFSGLVCKELSSD